MVSAREAAMLTLTACERQGAWSDGHLKKVLRETQMDRRDAALATRLCFGVLQNRMFLDWNLARFSSVELKKLDLKVLCTLRVALYQILFLDKIPVSAAVNEAVNLAKKHCRNPRAAGMVNGILRSVLREEVHPEPDQGDVAERLSVRYSHPLWLVKRFLRDFGQDGAQALLAAHNSQPPIFAQINTCRANADQVLSLLRSEGVEAELHSGIRNGLILSGTGNLEELTAFRQGLIYIQDSAARLAVAAAGVLPGQRVLDCCAAPGGKSFAAAVDMNNTGQIISCDIHPHKIRLLEAGRDRLGLDCICPTMQSATECREDWIDGFDTVITDVPCSGLGIIRKKPDIRYKDPAPLRNLPKIQLTILDNCSRYVKPGGVLLYSTCTVLSEENEDVVRDFLRKNDGFEPEPFDLLSFGVHSGMVTFWPHIHNTDGFFVAKLRRKE